MPAPNARAGSFWCTFFGRAPRYSAMMQTPGDARRRSLKHSAWRIGNLPAPMRPVPHRCACARHVGRSRRLYHTTTSRGYQWSRLPTTRPAHTEAAQRCQLLPNPRTDTQYEPLQRVYGRSRADRPTIRNFLRPTYSQSPAFRRSDRDEKLDSQAVLRPLINQD